MANAWLTALQNYNYYANLAEYDNRDQYSEGFTKPSFTAVIDRSNTKIFEEAFRTVIEARLYSKFSIIGEVCFWKIFNKNDPNSLTTRMLNFLEDQEKFHEFCINLHNLSENPNLNNFKKFRQSCGQPNGFAVPITFLSFYRSSQYPMADAYVSLWWNTNKSRFGCNLSKPFIPHGRISGSNQDVENNLEAYCDWTKFCQKYSLLLSSMTQIIWRARDVEMAVFYNQQKGSFTLNNLDENTIKSDNKISQQSQLSKYESLSITKICATPESKKDAHRLLAKSISLQNESDWPEALKNCELAIQFDPTNLKIWQNVALCLTKLSRYDDAKICYSKILSHDPNNEDARMGLNICLKRLNKNQEAELCDPFIDKGTNYAPKKYSYWSYGGGWRNR